MRSDGMEPGGIFEDGELNESGSGLLSVEGVIEGVRYQNEDNGYSVCDLAVSEEELITVDRKSVV